METILILLDIYFYDDCCNTRYAFLSDWLILKVAVKVTILLTSETWYKSTSVLWLCLSTYYSIYSTDQRDLLRRFI